MMANRDCKADSASWLPELLGGIAAMAAYGGVLLVSGGEPREVLVLLLAVALISSFLVGVLVARECEGC